MAPETAVAPVDDGIAGRVALVTGAAQGIGAAVVSALAGRGGHVAALDADAERLRPAAGLAIPADVRDAAAVEAAVDRVERELGPIGILVNVAGILRIGSILAMRDEDWAATWDVNATGVLHASRAVARRMVPRRRGSIVTVGSNAAGVPRMGMAAYGSSKAAAALLTKCLGLELAEHGIRCNVVSPGSTDTAMQRSLWRGSNGARAVIDGDPASFRLGIPLRRLAQPVDVAEAVAFLASDRARHITMHDLYVDGGATLRA